MTFALSICCQVVYKDGQSENLWLGIQRVRLMISPGEQLPPPDALALRQLAQRYVEQAQALEQHMQQQQRETGCDDDDLDDEVSGTGCPEPCTWQLHIANVGLLS